MEQKQKIIKIYKQKKNINDFDKNRSKYAYQRYKNKIEANFLKKAISGISSKNVKILDIACGTGRMLQVVFNTNKKIDYTGLDTSNEMFKELKKKEIFRKNKKDISLVISDATKIPFKNNFFDIVYTYHLLWHIPRKDQEKIIKEMLRITKKEGIIIFDILNKNFIWEKSKKYFGKKKSEGLYKQKIPEVKKILGNVDDIEIEKLSDAIIKNDTFYNFFNLINKLRIFLPSSFFHMIYFKMKKIKTESSYKIRKLKFFDIFKVWSMYKNNSKELEKTFMLAHNLRNFLFRFIFRRTHGFICLNKKEVIGFVFLFYLREEDIKTLGIMVKKDYQGKGIGKKLMSTILKNENKVRLDVVRGNKKAINLYKSFGFKEISESIEMTRELE